MNIALRFIVPSFVFLFVYSNSIVFAQGIPEMVGDWTNTNESNQTIKVVRTDFGYDAWVSGWGRGRIATSICTGGNIIISDDRQSCCYYVSYTGQRSAMLWQFKSGTSDRCPNLRGTFLRND